MDKQNQLNAYRKISVNDDAKFLLSDSENLHEYIWHSNRDCPKNNNDFVLLLMTCRSKVWYGLFCSLIEEMDLEEIMNALVMGKFRYMVPIGITDFIAKVDSSLAKKITLQPPGQYYNLILLDDDDELCSVHLIEPEQPTSIN